MYSLNYLTVRAELVEALDNLIKVLYLTPFDKLRANSHFKYFSTSSLPPVIDKDYD